jgi:hypothetical protein
MKPGGVSNQSDGMRRGYETMSGKIVKGRFQDNGKEV